MGPLTLRTRLTLALLTGAIVGLIVLTAAFNLVFSVTLNRDATALARERASSLADLAASELASGERLRPETRAGVGQPGWIFANGRELVRPRAAPVDEQAARHLASSGRSTIKVSTTNVLLAAEPIRVGKRVVGRAVAVVSLDPYERVREETLVGSILFSLLLVAAITAAGRYLIAAALRPVARMTERAAEWSERDLERRFALGEPRDELTRLAATLDRLLDRLVQSLRREQRFSAELAHELRTPLAGMIAQAQLALRGQRDADSYRRALADVLESARRMSACLDALLTAERAETSLTHGRSELGECAAAVAESHRPLAARAGVDIAVEPAPERVLVAAEPELVERALSPLVENGYRHGRRRVRVIVSGGSEQATVAVVDDGDGVAPDEVEAVFEPGRRGSQADTDHRGAGLGLALARRLARAAGGDVVARPGPPGHFELRLPRA